MSILSKNLRFFNTSFLHLSPVSPYQLPIIHHTPSTSLKTLYQNNSDDFDPNTASEIISKFKNKFNNNNPKGRGDPPNNEKFTRDNLISGLKSGSYKRVIFLTGAGISVSAGIPDFRSPKTGLYANLAAFNLPYPEAIFEIDFFRKKPEAFYRLAKELTSYNAKPTVSHHFIKMIADRNQLLFNFTQNIDGLETQAGVDPKYLVEAHGHSRSVRCIECKKEASAQTFADHVREQKIYRCECSGLIKPDIVFFGELLPDSFFEKVQRITEADLVIVMGTSLQVFPFASLVGEVPENVPLVYINRENTTIDRKNLLFLQGDIDQQVSQLIQDLGWTDQLHR